MYEYYKASIRKTNKPYGNKERWYVWDFATIETKTLKELKSKLKDEYMYCKTKYPIYRDGKDNKPYKVGYICSYKDESNKCYCRDWIEITKVIEMNLKEGR